jgi:hypothetical protein
MSKGNHRFKECELTRAIRATRKAGIEAFVARATPTGNIEIEISSAPQDEVPPANEWDEPA